MTIRVTTPQAFVALLKKDPKAAQAWLKEVAAHSENIVPAAELATLQKVASLGTDAFTKSAAALPLDALFGTTAVAEDDDKYDLPVVHGTLAVDRGARVQQGDQGYREWPDLKLTLTTEDGRSFGLESDHEAHNTIFGYVPGTDVMAFAGQQVSVRGHLDASGKVLRVTEFAPGTVKDFVSGRVVVEGSEVKVRARGRGLVDITDPDLKAQLVGHHNLGVIFEGPVSEKAQPDGRITRTFDRKLDEYWLLVKFTEAPTASSAGKVRGPIEAATSTTMTEVEIPSDAAQVIEVGDRMYVRGRFENGDIVATKATSSAGSPWTEATHARGAAMRSVIEFIDPADAV